MDGVSAHGCGLDSHTRTVVACLSVAGAGTRPRKQLRTFGTMTDARLALADWRAEQGVTDGALASTGVSWHWQPIDNLLEGRFSVLLVNARHVTAVPGRTTAGRDAAWRADSKAPRLAPAARRAGPPAAAAARVDALPHVARGGAGGGGQPAAADAGGGHRHAGRGGE